MKVRSLVIRIRQEGHSVNVYRKEWWGILRVWTPIMTMCSSSIEGADKMYEKLTYRFTK